LYQIENVFDYFRLNKAAKFELSFQNQRFSQEELKAKI